MATKSTRPHLSETESLLDKIIKHVWDGSKPNIDYQHCISGIINPTLKRKLTTNIKKIINDHSFFKIGKTGDPYIRADKTDYRKNYYHMFLIYKSTSKKNISLLEEHYIEKLMLLYPDKTRNKRVIAYGKEMFTYEGYYYLYIVTD